MKILAFILAALVSISATTAAASNHWYRIIISAGQHNTTFTGTSTLTPEQLSSALQRSEVIMLADLRDYFAGEGQKGMSWPADESVKTVHIPSQKIIYFATLPGDPAKPEAHAAAAAEPQQTLIKMNGNRLFVDGVEASSQTLPAMLKAIAESAPAHAVIIESEPRSGYQEVAKLMKACQEAGLWNLSLREAEGQRVK